MLILLLCVVHVAHVVLIWFRWSASKSRGEQGGGGDDDYWYLGGPQRFQANAAYSLFGVLKKHRDSGCSKKTYINSFFTSNGVENLAYPLGVDTSYIDTKCGNDRGSKDRALEASSADFERDVIQNRRRLEDQAANDDQANANDYNDYDGADGYSYGTGCSANLKYTSDSFAGGYCDGSRYLETVDTLDAFNGNMTALNCEQIYSSTDDSSAFSSLAYSILSYSYACSRKLYGNSCPDPFGVKTKYDRNLEKALNLAAQGQKWQKSASFPYLQLSLCLSLAGAGMLLYATKLNPPTTNTNNKTIEMSTLSPSSKKPRKGKGIFKGKDKSDSKTKNPQQPPITPNDQDNETSVISKMSEGVKNVALTIQQTFSGPLLDEDGISISYDKYCEDTKQGEDNDPVLSARREKEDEDDANLNKSKKTSRTPLSSFRKSLKNPFARKKTGS